MESPGAAVPPPGPSLDPVTDLVTFRVAHDDGGTPRRVWYHLKDHGADPTFRLEGAQWVARIPRPPVARMEYLLVVEWPDGTESMVTDPANPRRIRSVFGDKSVIEFPGYARPWWISVADAADDQARRADEHRAAAERGGAGIGRMRPRGPTSARTGASRLVAVPTPSTFAEDADPTQVFGEGVASVRMRPRYRGGDDRRRRAPAIRSHPVAALVAEQRTAHVVDADADVAITGQLHVPADSPPSEPLPLLVVHDGPEYADLAQLLRYLTTLVRTERGLRCRVLLLDPIDRDRSYSASPGYARALVTRMLPRVTGAVATSGRPVGMGASLGGLAMMHAATSYPGTFSGVFSQSGSFFRPRTDGMERGFPHYDRIVGFVDDLDVDPERLADLRVSMTCGTGEENLANNRSVAQRLARLGMPVALVENPDGHNYAGWRDCLDPSLRRLLRAAWGRTGSLHDH